MNNSSLFWSVTGVLAVFILTVMAIGGVENGPVRTPFKNVPDVTTGTNQAASSTNSAKVDNTGADIVNQVLEEGQLNSQPNSSPSTQNISPSESNSNLNFNAAGVTQQDFGTDSVNWNGSVIQTGTSENNVAAEPNIVNDITPELLRQAGFEHFIIKTKPFSGKILNLAELSELNTDQIKEFQIDLGNNQILDIDQIKTGNENLSKEYFDFLKNKFASMIGADINQTNQFGLASFYVNFKIENENVFLVVKYQSVVYALSYPRPTESPEKQNGGIAGPVKNLLTLLN